MGMGLPDCANCHGLGYIIPVEPESPARKCSCFQAAHSAGLSQGVPPRYAEASLKGFAAWWRAVHLRQLQEKGLVPAGEGLNQQVKTALTAVQQDDPTRFEAIMAILRSAGPQYPGEELEPYKLWGYATLPTQFGVYSAWAQSGKASPSLIVIEGAGETGKTSLAVAGLKAWGEARRTTGAFVDMVDFSGRLRSMHNDVRSFENRDFESEDFILAPWMRAPLLVLDRLAYLDDDIRLGRAFARLLFHRLDEMKPTIMTCESLDMLVTSNSFVFRRFPDDSLIRKLVAAPRVQMVTTAEKALQTAGDREASRA